MRDARGIRYPHDTRNGRDTHDTSYVRDATGDVVWRLISRSNV